MTKHTTSPSGGGSVKNPAGKARRSGLPFCIIHLFATLLLTASAFADEDLGGGTKTISTSNGLDSKTWINGTLNVTANQTFESETPTVLGSGLTVNQTSGAWGISGKCPLYIKDGAVVNYSSTSTPYFGKRIGVDCSYGNTTIVGMDNGTFNCTQAEVQFSARGSNSSYGKTVKVQFTMSNNSVFSVPSGKNIKFGGMARSSTNNSRNHTAMQVTVAVTNSSITAKEIILGQTSNYFNSPSSAFNKITFGPGSTLNLYHQIYAYKYPEPTVKFDGATINYLGTGGSSSFLGQHSEVKTDLYEILSGGLTIDIPSGKEVVCDTNASALKGAGGVTKTGEGSIVWNNISASSPATKMAFTGPLVVKAGSWTSTKDYDASEFRAEGGALTLSGALTADSVALSAVEGGELTLSGATLTDTTPDMTLASAGKTDYFTRDGTVATYTFDTFTLGESAILDLDANASGVDAISATAFNVEATATAPATININFAAMPGDGQTFTLFEADDAEKFLIVPKSGSLVIPHEKAIVDGRLVLTVSGSAKDYTWKATETNWGDAGAWTADGADASWADGNNAIFSTAGAAAVMAENAIAGKVTFNAGAAISGAGTLSAVEMATAAGVSATISAPTAGALTKTGPGALTLGAGRAEQTVLAEGTLAMSGSGTTLDWQEFTFGTDAAKPVTLRFTDGATAENLPAPFMLPALDGLSATLVKDCGDWTAGGDFLLGGKAGAPAAFIHNGGTLTVGGLLKIGDNADATSARLEINGGMVEAGDVVFTNATAGSDILVDLKEGGSLFVNRIRCGDCESGVCKFRFDGGVLKCKAAEPAAAHDGLSVTVAARGGTIDANGLAVTLGEPLLEEAESTGGGMTFKGGGTVTLAAGNTYTGTTAVEVGTTLVVPAPIAGTSLSFTVPQDLADGLYEVVKISGEGVFTADVLEGKGPGFALSADGKTVYYGKGDAVNLWTGGASGSLDEPQNWLSGTVPGAGKIAIFDCSAAASLTLPADAAFAPSAIVFTEESAAVAIDGDGEISGIVAVTNLSGAVSHTIGVPVRFAGDIQVKQAAVSTPDDLAKAHVTFAGGAYAAEGCTLNTGSSAAYSRCVFGKYFLAPAKESPWTLASGSGNRVSVAENSELHIPYAGSLMELYAAGNAKVVVGEVTMSERLVYQNLGEVSIGSLTVTGSSASSNKFLTYGQGKTAPAVFKFGGVTNKLSSTKWFCFGDANVVSKQTLFIGAGGIAFDTTTETCYCFGNEKDGTETTIRPLDSDFTINNRSSGSKQPIVFESTVVFNTDDEEGTGRTITIDAVTRSQRSPAITVSGSGTLKVNKSASNNVQPSVTVTDSATLAYKPGASLGTGLVTVNGGASLSLPESGTVSPGGNLTLAAGAKLAFALTGSDETTLSLSGKTLTLPQSGKVTVSVTKTNIDTKKKYTLVSGANLTEADLDKFTLSSKGGSLSVENGNLMFESRCFVIRIAAR